MYYDAKSLHHVHTWDPKNGKNPRGSKNRKMVAMDANIISLMGKILWEVKMTQKSFPPLEKGIGLGLTHMCTMHCILCIKTPRLSKNRKMMDAKQG